MEHAHVLLLSLEQIALCKKIALTIRFLPHKLLLLLMHAVFVEEMELPVSVVTELSMVPKKIFVEFVEEQEILVSKDVLSHLVQIV